MTKDELLILVKQYKSLADTLEHNEALFTIYEGDLLSYVLKDLQAQFSAKSFEAVKYRVAPINVLKRLVDKLSKIYAKPPQRKITGGSQKDQDLVDFYRTEMDMDNSMTLANEFFNLFKTCAIEPFLDRGNPKLRLIPSDRFFVYSNDPVNPMRPTHFVKIMGKIKRADGRESPLFYGYTDQEFLAFDDKGEIVTEIMMRPDISVLEGKNPYGKIPVVYVNRSKHDLTPKIDTDTLAMTKLIPILLSDLNYAVMFQAFSIIYGIDLDEENLSMSPNAFWRLKSDPNAASGNKPSIGVIKPEVNIHEVLSLIKAEMGFWLQSKNIKPGAMGNLSVEHMASGISKAIDEMDTSEDRQKQTMFFKDAEADLFDLLINNMHPVWMRDPSFKNRLGFSSGVKITTHFAEQRPIVDTSKQIDDQIKKLMAGLQDKRGALSELYPDWDDEQLDEKLEAIELDRTTEIVEAPGEEVDPDDVQVTQPAAAPVGPKVATAGEM
jgi:hypothetical protein